MTAPKLVLLFNTVADPSRAARIHADTCPMVRTAGKKVHRLPADQDIIEDLNEREFQVKKCKCCK